MTRWRGRLRPAMAMACAMAAAAMVTVSHSAHAFELKHTSHGTPLRWAESKVAYVVDPSVEQVVAGGAEGASKAIAGWNGAAGAPALSASVGPGGAKPGLDGQNSVLLAPHGFAPAGGALAVTVTSYDDATGGIVDADIVVNGIHPFAVLASGAQPPSGTVPTATDGSEDDDHTLVAVPYDLVHVVSHEVGHTLGLADERDDSAALMYAFTVAGDASMRAPSVDDVDGVGALYGPTRGGEMSSASSGGAGCGQASVAGSRTRSGDAWGAMVLAVAVGVWLASRQRARVVRGALPVSAAFVALLALPGSTVSPPAATLPTVAFARVVSVSTANVDGLFETTLELAPTACRNTLCPARARARAWGGSVGGITQRVGGADPVPAVGDEVVIAFEKDQQASALGAFDASPAAIIQSRASVTNSLRH
jgi:Matrixin